MHAYTLVRSKLLVGLLLMILCMGSVAAAAAFAMDLSATGSVVVSARDNEARGLYLTMDGQTLYVGRIHDHSIVKLDLASGKIDARANLLTVDSNAYGKAVWVDSTGNVWSPITAPVLTVYSPNLELKASYNLASFGLVDPEGAAVSSSGDIYVADRKGLGGIYKFRVENNKLVLVQNWGVNGHVNVGKDVRQPCLTPAEDLLVGSFAGSEIYLVKGTDGQVSVFAKDMKAPYHLASDAAGRVYVTHYNRADAALSVLKADGSVIKTWSAAELGIQSETSGVAVNKDGTKLYVLDQNASEGGTVRMFTIK